jgi:LemA protein
MKTEKGKKLWIWVVIAVIVVLGLYLVVAYNNFVGADQNVNAKWSEVENQYQRQADLIPNLISVVSSSVKIETSFVKDVTNARSRWQDSEKVYDKDKAGVEMNNGIAALVNAVAVSENYPQLQANKQYVALTDEISGTQNRITTARGRYIESIQTYNLAVKRFPGNIFANLFGFNVKEYYQAELGSMNTPKIGEGNLP